MPPRTPTQTNGKSRTGAGGQGLFDCFQTPCLAVAVYFCMSSAAGQLFQRMTGRAGSCVVVAGGLWVLVVLWTVTDALAVGLQESDPRAAGVLMQLAGVLAMFGTLGTVYALTVARSILRQRDALPPACGCPDGVDDCCVTYWCGCCAATQMFAHESVKGTDYRACTATGEP